MRIIPGDYPDVWFETSDLSSLALLIIRRESITCCGFLGGDTIQIIRSGTGFADLLELYRPVIPYSEREPGIADEIPDIQKRRDQIFTNLRSFSDIDDNEPANHISKWTEFLALINHTLWFAGLPDPFRYELELSGNIHDFLKGITYPDRLITCLRWWYRNEATSEEREQTPMIPVISELVYPVHHDLIIQAINLYNHGAYEVARGDESVTSPGSSYECPGKH